MDTFFLRFPDEESSLAPLEAAGIYIPPRDGLPGYYRDADHGWAFDLIGKIIKTPAIYDPETYEELTPAVALDGWHANFIGETLPEVLAPFVLDPPPRRPRRVFFT